MRVKLELGRNIVFDGAFDRIHVFARGDAGAVSDAEDVRVDGLSRLLPPHVQHNIGGLASYAGQGLQRGA